MAGGVATCRLSLVALLCGLSACSAPEASLPEGTAAPALRTHPHWSTDTGDLTPRACELLAAIEVTPESPTLAELLPLPPGVIAAVPPPPATIRVWRRGLDGSTASCSGRVDVIPF